MTRLNQPIRIEGWGKITVDQIPQLSETELIKLQQAVSAHLVSLKGQIERAKANRQTAGEYADADWFARVNGAARLYGMLHQATCADRSRRKAERKEGQESQMAWEREFVKAAKVLLSPKLYEDIVNVTNRNLKEQEKGGED